MKRIKPKPKKKKKPHTIPCSCGAPACIRTTLSRGDKVKITNSPYSAVERGEPGLVTQVTDNGAWIKVNATLVHTIGNKTYQKESTIHFEHGEFEQV